MARSDGEGWKLPDTPLEVADQTSLRTRDDLEGLSRDELYQLAQERDIAGRSDMTRDQLLRSLRQS